MKMEEKSFYNSSSLERGGVTHLQLAYFVNAVYVQLRLCTNPSRDL